MEIYLIAFSVILFFMLCLCIFLLLRKNHNEDMVNAIQRIDEMEKVMYEAMRDLRADQNMLARASRMESQNYSDKLSEQIDKKVARLADLTNKNLEQIRFTVDERLCESLDHKFALVSSRLEEMHRGLGEMQSLAGGVDELKRILTNVKTRGIWGEMQLASLIYDLLPKTMVEENVEIKKGSGCRVEFALRILSGKEVILLPIDAKFPQEDYQRLLNAREHGKQEEAGIMLKQLEKRLKSEAKDIKEKYILPPYSTDFAVMYLPSEGLFNEAVNIPGLLDTLHKTYRVCLAGPTTLTALLNSLQLGFRTITVQQNTAKVWELMAVIKNDFDTLITYLEKTDKKLSEAEASNEYTLKRIRNMYKKLEKAEELNLNTEGLNQNER